MIIVDNKVWILHPKTGCNTIRNALRNYYDIQQMDPFHGYDLRDADDALEVFTVVRKPAFWLRSYWGDRTRSRWSDPNNFTNDDAWKEICWNLNPPPNKRSWEDFWQWYYYHRAGFLYYSFGRYTRFASRIGTTEALADFLRFHFPDINNIGVDNVGPNLPKISWDAMINLEHAERDIMEVYYR